MINEFRGKYYFLSNFYEHKVKYNGLIFLNNESAFQAQKTIDLGTRESFCRLSPSQAKSKGRRVHLRSNWEQVKDNIMYEIVFNKFASDSAMTQKLLDTGDEILEEGNNWNDTYWGVCRGRGQNKLGKILMAVRMKLGRDI